MTDRAKLSAAITHLLYGLIAAMTVDACAPPPDASSARIVPSYGADGRLTRLAYDRDADGKVETWGYMDGARVVRVEIDEDGDGKIDRWEYHSDKVPGADAQGANAPGAPDHTIERIERATRHDGVINRREFFEHGLLVRVEEDTDGDGHVDKWETYAAGALTMIAIDTQHRGTPDRRMIYGADGALVRFETDASGSGSFATTKP